MIAVLLFAQAMMSVPMEPQDAPPPPADFGKLTIVVADAVSQRDPKPLCGRPTCLSLYLGDFANAEVLAGPALGPAFKARLPMGSPFNMRYRLALIVEQRPGQEPLVRSTAGFNDRTREACFDGPETQGWNWQVSGARIVRHGEVICVTA